MARSKKGGHPGKRASKKLRVIPKPDEGTASIIRLGHPGPFIEGGGGPRSTDYLCGACGRVLLAGMNPDQRVVNVVIECPCGAYNHTGGAPEMN